MIELNLNSGNIQL